MYLHLNVINEALYSVFKIRPRHTVKLINLLTRYVSRFGFQEKNCYLKILLDLDPHNRADGYFIFTHIIILHN